jgi:putative CocE/NonD family hydrolase
MQKELSTRPMWIVPKLTMRGTQLAGWTPKKLSQKIAKGILFDEDVEITLPDGTVLLADLFRPAGIERAPALVSWAAYVKDGERMGGGPIIDESGASSFIVPRGYVLIRIQPRGTGRSGGVQSPEIFSKQEVQDCHDAIEWVARQSWCNGQVGMTGMSYFTIIQLLVAATRPPSLKGIFPYKGMTDIYRLGFFKGGAAYNGALELFAAFERLKLPHIPATFRHILSYFINFDYFAFKTSDAKANEKKSRNIMKRITPAEDSCRDYVRRTFDQNFDSEYWRSCSPYEVMKNIELPLCIGTDYGAVGFHLFGAFELWHTTEADKRLFIGPAEYAFPWSNYHEELISWYDWQFKGIDNGYSEVPKVRYWLNGANRWQSATDWPLPEAKAQRLYLAKGNISAKEEQRLLTDAPSASTQSYLAIPSTSYYVKEIDKYEAQLLQYFTNPFEHDTEVVGPVHLHLTLSATAIDTYIVARISDEAPDGTRRKLGWGWLLASHRTIDQSRSNPTEIIHDHSREGAVQLIPGQPAKISFSITPIGNQFKKGHRLLLEIGSRPEYFVSEKNEGFDMFVWDPIPYRSRNTIFHGGEQASYLEVQVKPS